MVELQQQAEDALRQANDAKEQARQAQERARQAQEQARNTQEAARHAQEQANQAREQADKDMGENTQLKELNGRKDEELRKQQEEKEKVEERWRKGMQPEMRPTPAEISKAKENLQYKENHFHLAIAGVSGTGKSSLINALRGLHNSDPGASKTCVIEATSNIERYPDPDQNAPRAFIVWYDVPGAGTLDIPDWQYFNEQGLFIFDFIIVTFDNRFNATDIAILKNCERFGIPCYIVRSKADTNIENLMYDEEISEDEARKMFVENTHRDIESNLKKAGLDSKKKAYIICNRTLATYVKEQKTPTDAIDELKLVDDLMHTAREWCANKGVQVNGVN